MVCAWPMRELAPVTVIGRSTPLERRAPFAATFVALPVRTRLMHPGDDVVAAIAAAARGIACAGDVLAVSETAIAIAQGRAIAAETIRPSPLAFWLSRRAGALATVNQPESLQLVIDQAGAPKVVFASLAHAIGRLLRRRGWFYRVLGEHVSAIDGYTGTLPPFERTIVLGPENPDAVASAIAAASGAHAGIVDVNDLGIARVLGASRGVDRAAVEAALRSNPHGNGDEQTPLVILKWRAATQSPLLRSAA